MSKLSPKQVEMSAWLLSAAVVIVAMVAWWTGYKGKIVSTYQIFPLFGLLAFSLMWTHYMTAAFRKAYDIDKSVLKQYFSITSLVVLVAILLHPGLLAWQLWQDGLGLPPGSYFEAFGETYKIAILAGITSWLAFIAYEFRRKFRERSWWKYVQYASDVAMILIFIHALRLGGQLQSGWFRYVWYFYGITLAAALIYIHAGKYLLKKR